MVNTSPTTSGSSPASDNVFNKDYTDRYVASRTTTGSAPTNWFELAVELCYEGRITPERRDDAIKAVREALQ